MSLSIDPVITSFENLSIRSESPLPLLSDSPRALSRAESPLPLLAPSPPPPEPAYEIVAPPLFDYALTFDEDFLQSPEGRLVSTTIKWLIHAKGVQEKTVEAVYAQLNNALRGGSCYGQAQTFLQMYRRAQPFADTPATQIKVETLFSQIIWYITQTLHRTLVSLKQRHNKLKCKFTELQKLLCREKRELRMISDLPHQHRLQLTQRITALQFSKKLHIHDVQLHQKHNAKFQATRKAVFACLTKLNQMRKEKYTTAGLTSAPCCALQRAGLPPDAFSELVVQKIQALMQVPRYTDCIIGFHEVLADNSTSGHCFTVLPKDNLIFDAAHGTLQYRSSEALFKSLSDYFRSKNCRDVVILPKYANGETQA